MTLPLSIWTTGRPVPAAEERRGSFFDMIRSAVEPVWQGEIVDLDCMQASGLPPPDEVAGVIITGSPARIGSRDPWMLSVEDALRRYRDSPTPVLGICFGHQLMGMALGGEATANPRGREIGTVQLSHLEPDELIRPVAEFEANDTAAGRASDHVVMTHMDSVTALPPGARRLATTALEPNAAIRFGQRMWGVQFHPEMDAEIIGHYLEARRSDIEAEGLDVEQILTARVESSYGSRLLRRFAAYCGELLEERSVAQESKS